MPRGNDIFIDGEWRHVGPPYPTNLGSSVQKLRRGPSIEERHRAQVVAYANAVEKAILALQRRELMSVFDFAKLPPPNCASRTSHTRGEDIHRAVQQQQRAAILACPGQIRRARTPEQWTKMYAAAMKEKRAREIRTQAA